MIVNYVMEKEKSRNLKEDKMTIKPKHDSFIVHCDACPDYLEVYSTDFKDVLKEMKFYGWKTSKKDDEWVNKCPVCGEG